MLSEDSGNCSLNTYTDDSRKSTQSFDNLAKLSRSDWRNQFENKQVSFILHANKIILMNSDFL